VATGAHAIVGLDAYVSPAHRRFVQRRARAPLAPAAERFPVVVLFADITGFSALTSRLSAGGAAGAETLARVLNDRFGRLVDVVHAHGGEVQAFAGDAAVAFWPGGGDLAAAAQRAAACAGAIRAAVEGTAGSDNIPIRMRVAIGAGDALSVLVGGIDGRWHTLMGGDAWTDTLRAAAAAAARAGEIVLSPSVRELCDGGDGPAKAGHHDPGSSRPDPHVASGFSRTDRDDAPDPDLLRAGVPRSVQKRLAAGQGGWLAEFLTVTTVFVRVPGLQYDTTERLGDLQRAASTLQTVIHRYGGSVNDLLVDDNGTVLIAAWGVPMHAYEDNAIRATRAALTMQDELRALGRAPAIGVTTGRVFAGPVGNARRMRYALIGEPVILAVRFMQAGENQVLCDRPTRAAAFGRVSFGPSHPVHVAGRGEVGIGAAALESIDAPARAPSEIVGRQREARELQAAFAGASTGGQSRLVIVRGEPGIGKSTLVAAFLRHVHRSGARALTGSGDAMAASSPFHAWRPIFDALGVAEAELTAIIGRDVSAEATRDTLVQRFHAARGGDAPLVVVLEDAYWLDSASWSLAAEVFRAAPRLLLVVVTRPATDADPDHESRALVDHEHARILDLAVLPHEDALTLACRQLEVDALPGPIADLIRDRAEGHPLFTEQLVQTLLERGLIRVENHECHADPLVKMPDVPETLRGLIRSRIDLLAPEEQFTLKIASVFGRAVEVRGLLEIHPLPSDDTLEAQLANMARLDLLVTPLDEGSTCAFKHGIVQEVAYGTLSFEQRRRLHQAAAEWYETARAGEPASHSTLAHHWSEAGVLPKALWYLERAGAEALHAGNYRETVGLLGRALTAAADAPADLVSSHRRGVWMRQLGQASYSLGRLDDARAQLESAAALLGSPVPSSPARLGVATLRGTLSPWLPRFGGRRPLDPKADEEGAARYEAAWALETVSAIYYLNHDTMRTAYCLARRFELLGRLAPTDLFARSSAEMAFLWAYTGIGRQADRLFEQGWQMAQALKAPLTIARVLYSWSVFELGQGKWESCRSRAHRSAAIYNEFSEHRFRRDAELVEAYVDTFTGTWTHGASMYERLLRESSEHEALVQVAWCCLGLGKIRWREQRLQDALVLFDRGLETVRDSGDTVTRLNLIGARAAVRASAGDHAGAAADIRTAVPHMSTGMPSAFMVIEAYAGLAEAALILRQHGRGGIDRAELDRVARVACAALRKAAKVFPAARPAAQQWTDAWKHARRRSG
jgi:class 3 adenylate cyclase/tetratricopeptide (TPR) repeat protein